MKKLLRIQFSTKIKEDYNKAIIIGTLLNEPKLSTKILNNDLTYYSFNVLTGTKPQLFTLNVSIRSEKISNSLKLKRGDLLWLEGPIFYSLINGSELPTLVPDKIDILKDLTFRFKTDINSKYKC